jgi:LmbE family N-acetylglucosaminyl deacetylase
LDHQRKDLTGAVMLAVLAHPDDETFGTGGTLALYARRGASVYLVCATRGEAGEMDKDLLQEFDSAAERRSAELRCAALVLGLAGVHFLGYRDSGMPGSPDNQHPKALVAQPVDKVAAEIVHYVRLLKPQVVITFDPMGGYGHPDHIAVHRATKLAFELAGKGEFGDADSLPPHQAQKLYYQVIPRSFIRAGILMLRLLGKDPRKFGTNGDINLVEIARVRSPVNAAIDYRSVAGVREEAAACHVSQGGMQQSGGVMAVLRRLVASKETYMRGFPPPDKRRKERDLYAGVNFETKEGNGCKENE